MLRPTLMLAAAVMAGVPSLVAPPVPAEEEVSRPAPEEGKAGSAETAEEATIVVEGQPAETPPPFTIAPDPELARRYAPTERELNRITIPF